MATLAQPRYAGLSTETKPTTLPNGADIPVGSGFDEVDTRASFYWDGGQWVKVVAATASTASATGLDANELLTELYREMTALRLAVQETYNEGRGGDQVDFRELAVAITDRTETEEP